MRGMWPASSRPPTAGSLSLRDSDDPATLISRMSGRHHAIGEYLAENVLDMLEPQMLDFLMATSLTER